MSLLGKLMQLAGLVVLPVAMVMQLTGGIARHRRGFTVSAMLLLMVFGAVLFVLGRFSKAMPADRTLDRTFAHDTVAARCRLDCAFGPGSCPAGPAAAQFERAIVSAAGRSRSDSTPRAPRTSGKRQAVSRRRAVGRSGRGDPPRAGRRCLAARAGRSRTCPLTGFERYITAARISASGGWRRWLTKRRKRWPIIAAWSIRWRKPGCARARRTTTKRCCSASSTRPSPAASATTRCSSWAIWRWPAATMPLPAPPGSESRPRLTVPPSAASGASRCPPAVRSGCRCENSILPQTARELKPLLDSPGTAPPGCYPDTDLDLAAVRARLVLASMLEGSRERATVELAMLRLHAPASRGPARRPPRALCRSAAKPARRIRRLARAAPACRLAHVRRQRGPRQDRGQRGRSRRPAALVVPPAAADVRPRAGRRGPAARCRRR